MEAENFDTWLSDKFRELNTDEAVFVPYIKSIVEGDETTDEKIDALDGILGELTGDGNLDVESFRNEIMSRWEKHQKSLSGANGAAGDAGVELESKMEKLLKLSENLAASSGTNQDKTVDSALRAAILSQCQDSSGNESDGEGPSTSGGGGGGGGGGMPSSLERNTNAERVQSELKDKREREKEASAKKREKDKEDRAKQKQQAQDRKEKAKKKSTKVERKR